MAFKIGKQEGKEWDAIVSKMMGLSSELDEAVETYNAAMTDAFAALQEKVDAYNEGRQEVHDWLDERASGWRDEIGDRSEKWQEGENGQAADRFVTRIEEMRDELEEELEIYEPGPMDIDHLDWTEDNLPRGPEDV